MKTEEVEFTYQQRCVQTWSASIRVPKSVITKGDAAVIKWLQAHIVEWEDSELEDVDYEERIANSVELS
jgi:hypothetical protein